MNTKLKKVLKGAAIAGSGAILTYLMAEIPNVDFGPYTAAITAISSVLINAVLKYLETEKA